MSDSSSETHDLERRFGGLERLFGVDGAARIRRARVAVVGIGYAACQMFPLAMLPDVAAADSARTGRALSGSFTGVWTAGETLGLALGPLLFAGVLAFVGIGGVGSWAAEALARSGVGQLVLVDLDHVAESNINRQAQALSTTIGQAKVRAMQERIGLIHPQCQVTWRE